MENPRERVLEPREEAHASFIVVARDSRKCNAGGTLCLVRRAHVGKRDACVNQEARRRVPPKRRAARASQSSVLPFCESSP